MVFDFFPRESVRGKRRGSVRGESVCGVRGKCTAGRVCQGVGEVGAHQGNISVKMVQIMSQYLQNYTIKVKILLHASTGSIEAFWFFGRARD